MKLEQFKWSSMGFFFNPEIFLSHNAEYAFRVYLAQFQHTVRDIKTEENPFNGLLWGKYIKNIF